MQEAQGGRPVVPPWLRALCQGAATVGLRDVYEGEYKEGRRDARDAASTCTRRATPLRGQRKYSNFKGAWRLEAGI